MERTTKSNRRKRVRAKLRLYPDPILKVVCEPVHDDEDVSDVIRDMMYILTNSKSGVGLAAPQAGHTKRVIIVKPKDGWQSMINPLITSKRGRKCWATECCWSYPGRIRNIARPEEIAIDWTSERGVTFICEIYHDFTARIIQHEIDHLDGKCKVGET